MNDLQRQAMIDFCVANAGEIKYVPEFNEQGRCTVKASITAEIARRLAKTLSNSVGPKEGQGIPDSVAASNVVEQLNEIFNDLA